jgi:hypothetical protein
MNEQQNISMAKEVKQMAVNHFTTYLYYIPGSNHRQKIVASNNNKLVVVYMQVEF